MQPCVLCFVGHIDEEVTGTRSPLSCRFGAPRRALLGEHVVVAGHVWCPIQKAMLGVVANPGTIDCDCGEVVEYGLDYPRRWSRRWWGWQFQEARYVGMLCLVEIALIWDAAGRPTEN